MSNLSALKFSEITVATGLMHWRISAIYTKGAIRNKDERAKKDK